MGKNFSKSHSSPPRVLFLALGTRGDAVPLICTAVEFLWLADCSQNEELEKLECVVVCGGEVSVDEYKHAHKRLTLRQVDTPDEMEGEDDNSYRERVLKIEQSQCILHSAGAVAVIFNFFSMVGYHISEKLSIPRLIMSPCIIPYGPPSAFESAFNKNYAGVRAALTRAGEQDQVGGSANVKSVVWNDIIHWMWRLFMEDQGNSRQTLGLNPSPIPSADQLPVSVPVLYCHSPDLVSRSPEWTDSVKQIGFCDEWRVRPRDVVPMNDMLARFLSEESNKKTMFVSFGSMDSSLGLVSHGKMAKIMSRVGKECNIRIILQLFRASASGRYDVLEDNEEVLIGFGDMDHGKILEKASVFMHHGGAGTVGAAARAGATQVIVPYMFDQKWWAEKVEWLGIGCSVDNEANADAFVAAVKRAMENNFVESAQRYKNLMSHTADAAVVAASEIKECILNFVASTPPSHGHSHSHSGHSHASQHGHLH